MELKLFVDDFRKCPEGWVVARTVTEAIRFIATQSIKEVSLDHDIACEPAVGGSHTSWETFEPVARYLALLNEMYKLTNTVPIEIKIHTANPQGGKKMADILGMEYNNEIYNPDNY